MKVHYVGCDMINLYILTKLFITYALVVCLINDKNATILHISLLDTI